MFTSLVGNSLIDQKEDHMLLTEKQRNDIRTLQESTKRLMSKRSRDTPASFTIVAPNDFKPTHSVCGGTGEQNIDHETAKE